MTSNVRNINSARAPELDQLNENSEIPEITEQARSDVDQLIDDEFSLNFDKPWITQFSRVENNEKDLLVSKYLMNQVSLALENVVIDDMYLPTPWVRSDKQTVESPDIFTPIKPAKLDKTSIYVSRGFFDTEGNITMVWELHIWPEHKMFWWKDNFTKGLKFTLSKDGEWFSWYIRMHNPEDDHVEPALLNIYEDFEEENGVLTEEDKENIIQTYCDAEIKVSDIEVFVPKSDNLDNSDSQDDIVSFKTWLETRDPNDLEDSTFLSAADINQDGVATILDPEVVLQKNNTLKTILWIITIVGVTNGITYHISNTEIEQQTRKEAVTLQEPSNIAYASNSTNNLEVLPEHIVTRGENLTKLYWNIPGFKSYIQSLNNKAQIIQPWNILQVFLKNREIDYITKKGNKKSEAVKLNNII